MCLSNLKKMHVSNALCIYSFLHFHLQIKAKNYDKVEKVSAQPESWFIML